MNTEVYNRSLAKAERVRALLRRKKVSKTLQALLSASLLAYLASILKWRELLHLIQETKSNLLLIAPILLLLAVLFSAARWYYILKDMNINRKIKQLYSYYLIGMFYSVFLPGAIGGDVARVAGCNSEEDDSLTKITTSVIIERICGLTALFLMGSFAISFLLPPSALSALGTSVIIYVKIVSIALFVVLLVLLFKNLLGYTSVLEHKFERLKRGFPNILGSIKQLTRVTVLVTFIFSGLFQSFDIVSSFIIAKALGMSISLPLLFAIMPVVYMFTILPVSLGGLGVREGSLVFLLTKVNVPASDAVALSFMLYINRVAVGTLGGIIHLFSAKPVKTIILVKNEMCFIQL